VTRYALIAALVACLGLGGAASYLWHRNATLRAENDALSIRVNGCSARIQNIIKDMRSDNEIDAIPDDGLRDVPSGWLLPSP